MHQTDRRLVVYHSRRPQESPLWRLLNQHCYRFASEYEDRFQKTHGFFRKVISDVVQKFLQCGDLRQCFARVRCPECRHEYRLAFSCRGRRFCPKCHAEMKILSFITVSQPDVIQRILEHLGLWKDRDVKSRPPPEVIEDPFDDGWPGYEEPFLAVI